MNSTARFGLLLMSLAAAGSATAGCDGRTFVGSENDPFRGAKSDAGRTDGGGGDGSASGGDGSASGGDGSASGGDGNTGGGDGAGGCPVAGTANTPTTVEAMRQALTRVWLLCSPLGVPDQPHAGLEIRPGDRYWLMTRDPSGNLVGQVGVDFEGSVTYTESGVGPIQFNMHSDLGWGFLTFPVITMDPTVLIISGGQEDYRYVPAGP